MLALVAKERGPLQGGKTITREGGLRHFRRKARVETPTKENNLRKGTLP